MQRWVDQASSAMSRAEVWQMSRHVADQAITSSRHVVEQAAERASHQDGWGVARTYACGTVETLRDSVRAWADEATRLDAVATTAHLVEETLEMLRRQLELTFETLEGLGTLVQENMEAKPGPVTRVDIDAEQVGRVVEPRVSTS
jgi:hypothetical protein